MIVEKSAGAVIFYRVDKKIEYLLLHYQAGHWDFPKGNIEKGEKLEDTARREIKEETGIENVEFILGFKENIKYFYKKKNDINSHVPIRIPRGQGPRVGYSHTIFKIVTYFLAETKTKKVKISWEHIGFKWLTLEEALEQLTFKNAKEILKKASDFLKSYYG